MVKFPMQENYSLTITHCLLSVHWCVRMKSSVKEAVFLVARAMPSTGVPLNIIFLTTTSTKWTYNLKEILRKKIAIIGSGPAGITLAFVLAQKGYDITIFELRDKIGGVLQYGIPAFRLPKDILDRLKDQLVNMGVKIRPNTLVGPVITIDDLFRDGYRAIFIGTGVWNPKPMRIKGESLGHVHYAIDYLKNPSSFQIGKKVCVIGAGNVAMDVARTAVRRGAKEVSIMYRRAEEDMPASQHEIKYAKLDGVKFEFFKSPVEINDDGIKYYETKKSHRGRARKAYNP